MRLLLAIIFVAGLQLCTGKNSYVLQEKWVCNVKQSCADCLRLSHCSWCKSESKCFSKSLDPDYCIGDTTNHQNFGFSIEDNARCACDGEPAVRNCTPPDQISQECYGRGQCVCGRCLCDSPDPDHPSKITQECYGRGQCVCGRCLCDSLDPDHPSKMVMGEYCEFDNFLCDGPKCNEGPYSLNQPRNLEASLEDI